MTLRKMRGATCAGTWTASPRSTTRPGRRNWGFVAVLEEGPRRLRAGAAARLRRGLVHGRREGRRGRSRWRSPCPTSTRCCAKMNGRLLPFGWWHFLAQAQTIDRVRVGFLGVKPEYQHTGVAARALRRALRRRPTRAPEGRRDGLDPRDQQGDEPRHGGDGRPRRQALPRLRARADAVRRPQLAAVVGDAFDVQPPLCRRAWTRPPSQAVVARWRPSRARAMPRCVPATAEPRPIRPARRALSRPSRRSRGGRWRRGFAAGVVTVAGGAAPARAQSAAHAVAARSARQGRRQSLACWSTCTCSATASCERTLSLLAGLRRACGGEVRPRWPFRLPRRRAATACCAAAAACSSGCCTTASEPVIVRVRPSARDRSCSARCGGHVATPPTTAIERMRFALGARRRPAPVPRAVPRRPADRAARAPAAVAAPEPPARAVRGARLGDLRAADRGRARARDPAPDRRAASGRRCDAHRPCATLPARGDARRRGARRCWSPSTSAGARALALVRAAREVASGPRRPARRPTTSAAGGGCARSPGSGRGRSRCSPCTARAATTSCRRATSPTSSSSGAASGGDPRRGARPRTRCASLPYDVGGLAAHVSRRLAGAVPLPAQTPCPGRNSLVIARRASGSRFSSPFRSIQRRRPATVGLCQPNGFVASVGKNTGSVASTLRGWSPRSRSGCFEQRVDARCRVRRAAAWCPRARPA